MNTTLLALGALAVSALLIPGDAEAQRFGGRGGGGARMGGGGFGGGGAFRGGGFGGQRMFVPRGGMSGARVGMGGGGFPGRAIAARPGRGDFRMAAIGRPGYGGRAPYYGRVGGNYSPYSRGYYRRGYPYYGGALAAGLALGALSYPYYGYGYNYPYYGYDPTTVAYGEDCYWVRRRVVSFNGRVFIRREQVCNY
jgi:hypothetical protein